MVTSCRNAERPPADVETRARDGDLLHRHRLVPRSVVAERLHPRRREPLRDVTRGTLVARATRCRAPPWSRRRGPIVRCHHARVSASAGLPSGACRSAMTGTTRESMAALDVMGVGEPKRKHDANAMLTRTVRHCEEAPRGDGSRSSSSSAFGRAALPAVLSKMHQTSRASRAASATCCASALIHASS